MSTALRYNLGTAAVLAISVCVTAAHADSSSDARKAVTSVYRKRDAAAAKRDLKSTLATTTPDFVYVAKDGQKGDLKALKKRLGSVFALTQSLKSVSTVKSFSVHGKEAIATANWRLSIVAMDPQTQLPRHFDAESTSEDVWVKTGTGWLQKRMTVKQERASLDGKPIDEQLDLGGAKRPGKKQ